MRLGRIGRAIALAAALGGAAIAPVAGAAPDDERRVLVGLERRSAALDRFLQDVSDPGSPRYREYATVAQLRSRYGARPATVRAVRTALARHGVRASLDPTGAFLVAPMTDAQVDAVLGEGRAALEANGGDAATAPSALPAELRGHVTELAGLTDGETATGDDDSRRTTVRDLRREVGLELPSRSGRAAGCEAGREVPIPGLGELAPLYAGTKPFTPNQFRTAFGFDALHRAGIRGQGTRIALLEFDGAVRRADLREYARCFGIAEPRMRVHTVGREAPIAPVEGGASLEATLDVQAIMMAAPRARIDLVEGNGRTVTMAETLATALDAKRLGGLPDVVSISYGTCELMWESEGGAGNGPAGRRLFDHVARVAGGAGVSVTVATGDAGSSACSQRQVLPLDGSGIRALIPIGAPFVGYPASSPAVTAVGGTAMRLDARNRLASLRPWNDTAYGIPAIRFGEIEGISVASFVAGGGTGGTSRLYRQPSYQEAAGLRSGRRTVPDVSMYADSAPGIAIYCTAWDPATATGPCPPNPVTGNGWNPVGGTSFAAPLLAGGIALANQYAEAKGAPRVGFVNPLLYTPATRRANVFTDVRKGTNALLPVGCCAAGAGYDQATGWGTVDVTRMARAAQAAWTRREGGAG